VLGPTNPNQFEPVGDARGWIGATGAILMRPAQHVQRRIGAQCFFDKKATSTLLTDALSLAIPRFGAGQHRHAACHFQKPYRLGGFAGGVGLRG